MAELRVLTFPDRRLRRKAKPVAVAGEQLRRLADDMLETMYASKGVGLAAIQVNVAERVLVMDVSEERDTPRCYVNPEIVSSEGEVVSEEGCLSVPEFTAEVPRAERVKVRAYTTEMEPVEEELEGLASICIQHEIDHLDGKLFIDYLSPLKRRMLRKRLEKAERTGKPAVLEF
ncbi:MAG: peptide deformylase [Gammaproteobacteria bacterium]|nr:peptide deformylase [Gammaproteobacteria bacterium]MXW45543.1 peptide deformylase [Gammaproteobacteria bacterium]MYD01477.1 peptide deformylase [Gammaproteobacteria bacterium]MYI26155.1 peptide deformylase [Gammaproteobacteria bacterium]